MRVLGVDPGSLKTGWGVLEGDPSRPRLVECGIVRLRSGLSLAGRLALLHGEIEALVDRLRPTSAAVEAPFHGASARSALLLAHARGAILAALGSTGVEVSEYSPAMVKKSVTGNGRADKAQVEQMVACLLRDDRSRATHDISDALAVALCHLTTRRRESLVRNAAARSSGTPGGARPGRS